MCRKILFLIPILLLLITTSSAWPADIYWDGGGDGVSWDDPCNWDTNSVPGPADDAYLEIPSTSYVRMDSGAHVGSLRAPAWESRIPGGNQTLDLYGKVYVGGIWRFADDADDANTLAATANIYGAEVVDQGEWRMADSNTTTAYVNLYGGSVSCTGLKFGDYGSGVLNVRGNAQISVVADSLQCIAVPASSDVTLNVGPGLIRTVGNLRGGDDGPMAYGNVQINLDYGTIEAAGTIEMKGDITWNIDIDDGKLVLQGNQVSTINNYIGSGNITAFDGAGTAQAAIVDANTVVTGTIANYRWIKDPTPSDCAYNLCPNSVSLSWTAAPGATAHDVYIGTSFDDVDDANTSSDEFKAQTTDPNYDPVALSPGVMYYWRVDEVIGGTTYKAKMVWILTTNDRGAYDPSPDLGETGVLIGTNLDWTGGCGAVSHDVYLGTDWRAVRDATTLSDEFIKNQSGTSYDPPEDFNKDTSYYWRIDERDGGGAVLNEGTVWKFATESVIIDVNMLAWYKFDEGSGSTAVDSSGYGHHAGVVGDPFGAWADGRVGPNCIDFSDGWSLSVPTNTLSGLNKAITIAFWYNRNPDLGASETVTILDAGDSGEAGTHKLSVYLPYGTTAPVRWRAGDDSGDICDWGLPRPEEWTSEWHHFAFVKDEDAGVMRIYLDSMLEKEKDTEVSSGTLANVANKTFHIGSTNDETGSEIGYLDDMYIYDRVLSDGEIRGLMISDDPYRAWRPSPDDGDSDVPTDAVLSWQAGIGAQFHDVYFGTSFDVVNDANTSTAGVYKGQQGLTELDYDPGALQFRTTYYWRIDEVNTVDPNLWKGRIWRFTVGDFLVIDDVESYDDDALKPQNPIAATWIDGWVNYTGSTVYLEYGSDATVHGGRKAMLLEYENDWPDPAVEKYSEVYADTTGPQSLDFGKDWTRDEVRALTLFFHGDPDNEPEPLYIVLEDTSEANYVSSYGNTSDEQVSEWHQWDVPLSDFNDNGVNIADVNRIRIGLGDRDNPVAGGSGFLFFDDIRLYLRRCVPWRVKPQHDFSDNCIVDLADIRLMAADWLDSDVNVAPITRPGNPILHYAFEDASGSTITDVNSYRGPYHGTYFIDVNQALGDVNDRVDPGWSGNSFHFPPDPRGGIAIPAAMWTENAFSQEITITAWIKNAHPLDEAPESSAYMWEFREWDGSSPTGGDRVVAVQVEDTGDNYVLRDQSESVTYEHEWESHLGWRHYGFVRNDSNLAIYVNGVLEEISDSNGAAMAAPQLLYVAVAADLSPLSIEDLHDAFVGNMDEFKIFNYALTRPEIAHMASDGTGIASLSSGYNVYAEEPLGKGAINFKDFAVVAAAWLEQILWP